MLLVGVQVVRKVINAGGPGRKEGKPAIAVEVATVGTGTIRNIESYSGTLQARSLFNVAPRVAGRIKKLHVDIGDRIESGRLVVELDDEEYVQQEEQAKSELAVSKANVDEAASAMEAAKKEFERSLTLRNKKILSESEMDEAQMQYKAKLAKYNVAQAQVNSKEASLKQAQVQLSYTRIAATWEGDGVRYVGEKFADAGATLKANDLIVSIVDLERLTAVLHVTERDYPKILIGQKVVVSTDAYPGKVFTGTVERLAPVVKETSREARVEVEVPNDGNLLKPGMYIRTRIELARHDRATLASQEALVERGNQRGVFQVDLQARMARFVPVTVGIIEGDQAEILSPDLSGATVVTLGHHLLEDGSGVNIVQSASAIDGQAEGKHSSDRATSASSAPAGATTRDSAGAAAGAGR